MMHLRGTYVHRGDGARTQRRIKHALLITATLIAVALFGSSRQSQVALAGDAPAFSFGLGDTELRDQLDDARGERDLAHAQLQRLERVFAFSSQYGIAADLAAAIHDIALVEGIDPELAFRLVKLESRFDERATSPVGAIGLAQVMLPTARYFRKDITREDLYDRETNLRIGFRYLRSLLESYDGDLKLALLAYNRGPTAVQNAITDGRDPANGYERVILTGYRGTGLAQ
jgi:soluble lytic murein transglycosylase-like protein